MKLEQNIIGTVTLPVIELRGITSHSQDIDSESEDQRSSDQVVTMNFKRGLKMSEILQKIKDTNTMKEMDDLRDDVLKEKTNESLQAWQKKYRNLKCFRNTEDKGYRY